MYSYTHETALLLNRVGWQGYSLPESFSFVLNSDNKKSESGLYYDYVGSLATSRNVCELSNEVVNTSEALNELLLGIEKQAINNMLHAIFSDVMGICAATPLYTLERTRKKNRVNEGDKFVGFRLLPNMQELSILVERIGLLFNADTTFNLYLFNSQNLVKGQEVAKQEVTVVAGVTSIVNLVDFVASGSVLGGAWYLGYFEDEITPTSALYFETGETPNELNHIWLDRIKQPTENNGGVVSIDIDNRTSDANGNGLNPYFAVVRDFGGFIANNKPLFDKAIQMQMRMNICELILHSTRTNYNSEQYEQKLNAAFLELNGDPEKRLLGLSYKFTKEVEAIKKVLFQQAFISKATLI